MRFRVLGPTEVVSDTGTLVPVTAPKVLTLLALLLVNRDRAMPAEQVGGMLWPGKPRARQASALRFHIWKLRTALEPCRPERADGTVVLKIGRGYVLDLTGHTIDSLEFEIQLRLARENLARFPANASAHLDDALSLWRGDALCDARYEDFAQAEIRRLESLRLDAEALRIECYLALGRLADAIASLERLTTEHPDAERFWAQLMSALCRDGRPCDAARAYQRARIITLDDLGIEPSPVLQKLNEDIRLSQSRVPRDPRSNPSIPVTHVAG